MKSQTRRPDGSTLAVVLLAAVAGLAVADPDPSPCKVCVSEPKANTRKVYACKCEDYCLPRCGLLSWLWGHCGCGDGPCGELRIRHRLVVKKVPDCDTKQCVPRTPGKP
jgi:hypothetical protein